MLAVVQQQHDLEVGQHRGQALAEADVGPSVDGEGGGHLVDGGLLARRRQLHEHDGPLGTGGAQVVADLDDQPRLADAPGAEERHQAVLLDQCGRLGEQVVAADQRT